MIEYLQSRRGVIAFAFAVMLVTCLPYLIGYQVQGSDWSYTGFVIGVEDGNSYLSKMRSGATGDWLFRSKHSTLEQTATIAYIPYLLLGKLAADPEDHTQLVALYHGFRLISGMLAILATYDLISVFIQKTKTRWWALVLATLGGGLGWMLVAGSQKGFLGSLPLDFISPETFGFIGLLGFPHLSAARALLLFGLVLFLNQKNGYPAGFTWLAMSFFQPMVGLVAWAVIGVYSLAVYAAEKTNRGEAIVTGNPGFQQGITKAFQAVAVSSPLVIYTAIIFLTNPYYIGWNDQNRFTSPHPLHYLIAYGPVLPFAIAGAIRIIKAGQKTGLLLAAWMAVFPFLVYAPLVSQRRLAEGFWVCLVIGMFSLYDGKEVPAAAKFVTCALFPSTLFLLIGSFQSVLKPDQPLFRSKAEIAAYQALKTLAPANAGVLSSFEIGNNLPARVPVKAVIGHGPETVGLLEIEAELDAFFNGTDSDALCNAFLASVNADFLFWGPEEEKDWSLDPAELSCMVELYNSDGYRIFEFRE